MKVSRGANKGRDERKAHSIASDRAAAAPCAVDEVAALAASVASTQKTSASATGRKSSARTRNLGCPGRSIR